MHILGELKPAKGFILAPKTKSYKPQDDWIFNGTIRQNILFGEKFDKYKYQDVLQSCCFEKVCIHL